MSSENLKRYLERRGVNARLLRFEGHTMTVDAAVGRLGINRERIIKSILFIDDWGWPILAIVTGDKKVDEKKLAIACGAKKVVRANPAEVKKFTGHEVGAVPPVNHKRQIRTFIDEKVVTFDKVIGGGGEINVLLEIGTDDMRKLAKGQIKNIAT